MTQLAFGMAGLGLLSPGPVSPVASVLDIYLLWIGCVDGGFSFNTV